MNITYESDCTVGMDSRIVVDGNHLKMLNVKKADTRVVQCNASNVHGYLLAAAYLNVQGNSGVHYVDTNELHIWKNVIAFCIPICVICLT